MRTTLILDEALLEKARQLSGFTRENGRAARRARSVDCSRKRPPPGRPRHPRSIGRHPGRAVSDLFRALQYSLIGDGPAGSTFRAMLGPSSFESGPQVGGSFARELNQLRFASKCDGLPLTPSMDWKDSYVCYWNCGELGLRYPPSRPPFSCICGYEPRKPQGWRSCRNCSISLSRGPVACVALWRARDWSD